MRYSATHAMTIARRSARSNPRSRPRTSKLAASRFTSHSHGPGRVSSKSLMSKSSCRSGEAKTPKFDRCASPQSCVWIPETGSRRKVGGHDQRAAAVERERAVEHPPVPDRNERRDAIGGLLLDQRDRIGPVGGRRPVAVRPSRRRLPCRAPARDPLLHGEMLVPSRPGGAHARESISSDRSRAAPAARDSVALSRLRGLAS